MKLSLLPSVAVLIVATGIAAHAADNKTMSSSSGSNAQAGAQDQLSLTRVQERTAWRDLSRNAKSQTAPSSFTPSVGATVPDGITFQAMPQRAANQLPALKPYDFALLQNKLLIINPNDKKVVEVIGRKA
jgi:uncharacterized protein DUF1236